MKRMMLTAMVVALCLTATPAFAISAITNYFSVSDRTVSTGQTVKIYPKTVADHMGGVPTNPYPTNFLTEVKATHFNRPLPFSTSGLPNPNSFTYMSSGRYVSPCYHYYSGEIWIYNPKTLYNYCTASIKAATSGSRYGSRHGQLVAGTGDSTGDSVWIYTTHN